MRSPYRSLLLGTALIVPLGASAAACGGDDDSAATEATAATAMSTPAMTAPLPSASATAKSADTAHSGEDGDDDEEHVPVGATEVEEPTPRLAVADAESGSVELLDLASGEALGTFEATGPASLSSDGRFVFATDYEGGAVTVIDTGSWVVDHGDHGHAYIAEPEALGALTGDDPAHVVPNEGFTSIFFDGTGTAEVLHEDELEDGSLEPELTFETSSPHHGVVVAFADHFAVSIPGPTPDDLPVGVEVRHDDGEVEASFEDCPEMHGEAGFTDGVLLACEDGVLWVTGGEGTWDATKIAYPAGTPTADRTWSFAHTHGVAVVAGALGETALLVVDTEAGEARRIELPTAPVAVAVADGGEHLVGLTADGQLHLIDAAAGTIESSGPITGAVDVESSEDGPPTPQIVVTGQRAYVSDPTAATILEVAFADDMRVARSFDVGVVPAQLALTGAL